MILAAMQRDLETIPGAEDYACQPLASRAYIEWWLNHDRQADTHSNQALRIDPDTTLAIIVHTALTQRIHPAWAHTR